MNAKELANLVYENDLPPVWSESDPGWRHGTYETHIYEIEGRFWKATFRLSTDGETNELAEGLASVVEVEPYAETVTLYRPVGSSVTAGGD